MIKYLFTLIKLFVFSSIVFAQNFEGILTYKIEYSNVNPDINAEELIENLGDQTTTYIKDGFYLDKTNSTYTTLLLFRNQDSSIYFYHKPTSDTLYVAKTIDKHPGVLKYSITLNADTILGLICDRLMIEDDYGVKSFYYNSSLALNPNHYSNYTLDNKYGIMKIMKSVYLRLEMNFSSYSVNIIATKIKKEKLRDQVFNIPKGKVLKTIN